LPKRYRVSFLIRIEANFPRSDDLLATVTEHLRYAAVIGVYGKGHTQTPPYQVREALQGTLQNFISSDEVIVTIYQPHDSNGKVWAEQTAARIWSFGNKAEVWTE